jgi:hypothetical protein
LIDKLYKMDKLQKNKYEMGNLRLFDECFCLDVFGENYKRLIESL